MDYSTLCSLLLILLVVSVIIHARNYDIIIQRLEGPECDPQYVDVSSSYVKLRKTSRNAPAGVNVLLNLTRTLPSETRVQIQIFEINNNKPRVFINYEKNFCDYLLHEKMPLFKEYVYALEMPPACPVTPKAYHTEDWRFKDEMLPPVLPGPPFLKFKATLKLKEHVLYSFSGFAEKRLRS